MATSEHCGDVSEPPPIDENVTEPTGADAFPPLASATVAVHVEASVAVTGDAQTTPVTDARFRTRRLVVPTSPIRPRMRR